MKPGLYVATAGGEPGSIVYGPMGNGQMIRLGAPWRIDGRTKYLSSGSIVDARPLLVIDPENDDHVEGLANELRESPGVVRAALRTFVDSGPSRRSGRLVRRISVPSQMWVCGLDMKWRDEYGTVWPEIPNDVEVLSEGWSE